MYYRWAEFLLVSSWTLALFLHDLGHRLIQQGFDPDQGPIGFGLWYFLLSWREEPSFWNGLLMLCGGSLALPGPLTGAPWPSRLGYFAAGPAMNLAAAGLTFSLLPHVPAGLQDVAAYVAGANLALGLISLLPIPGLDGAHLIATLWRRVTRDG